jgi:molybdenum cofactor synthesis domain-containing protein
MAARPSTAAIVVIGDEILSGKYADENATYLIRELRELGVAVRKVVVIPDVVEEIARTVRECSERYDHVFTSGGIGPTHDDLTIEGVARAFGLRIVRHPDLELMLRMFYGDRLQERNLRMADVPEGAVMIGADHPSWPVTSVRNVYVLPGIPAIFRRKFDAIRERFRGAPFHVRRVFVMAEEGAIAAHLDQVVGAHPGVAIGSYPRIEAQDYRVVVTLECQDEHECARAADALARLLPDGVVVRVE